MGAFLLIAGIVLVLIVYFVMREMLIKYDAQIQYTYGYHAFGFIGVSLSLLFFGSVVFSSVMWIGFLTLPLTAALLVFVNLKNLQKSGGGFGTPVLVKLTLAQLLFTLLIIARLLTEAVITISKHLMAAMQATAFSGSTSVKTATGRRVSHSEAVRLEYERLLGKEQSDDETLV